MKKITFSRRVCLTAIVAALALPTMLAGMALSHAADDSSYGAKDITLKEIKADKEGKVEITFTTKRETLYGCPGANAKTTKEGIELTFVRSSTKPAMNMKKPKVTYPATFVWKLHEPAVEVITVTANGKSIFLRDGEKLVKLFSKGKAALPLGIITKTKETDPAGDVSENEQPVETEAKSFDVEKAAAAASTATFDAIMSARADSVYGEKDISLKEIKAENEGKVEITFASKLETLYYCPGANAKTTEKGIELTFVRSYYKKKPKVTYPATFMRKWHGPVEEVITVTANGKSIFLRDGEKLVKLFPKD